MQAVRKIKTIQRAPQLKVSRFRKRTKTRKIEVVSRKSQGARWKQTIIAPKLDVSVSFGGPVASSWIGEIDWFQSGQNAYMQLLNGYEYFVFVPFSMFEAWYYSPSKGTYFNEYIKGKYRVIRIK